MGGGGGISIVNGGGGGINVLFFLPNIMSAIVCGKFFVGEV